MAKAIKFGSLGDLFSKAFHITKGATFASLYTETEVDLTLGAIEEVKEVFLPTQPLHLWNDYKDIKVTKKQNHNCQLNFSYSNAVNNQRMLEGGDPDFIPQAPKWGTRIPGTPLISHIKKGSDITSFYLMTRVLRSTPSDYYINGKFVDSIPVVEAIKGNVRHYPSKSQGTEKEIVIRTFKLDSIKAITMDGETLVVER